MSRDVFEELEHKQTEIVMWINDMRLIEALKVPPDSVITTVHGTTLHCFYIKSATVLQTEVSRAIYSLEPMNGQKTGTFL